MTKPFLRIATPNIPGHSEIVLMNGKQKLKGLRMLIMIVDLFERAGFNVSMVPVSEATAGIPDENGTYNGLFGAVQAGKADTSTSCAPLTLAESIGKLTPVVADSGDLIITNREPTQTHSGTLLDCLTTLGLFNNILLATIIAIVLVTLSLFISKRSSWNFFAQLMTEDFGHSFRPLFMQLTFIFALSIVRTLFGSAYSTDVIIASPPKLINSLEDLARSNLLPLWIKGDPLYLEFRERVTTTHADVFNLGPKNRKKLLALTDIMNKKTVSETNALLLNEFTVVSAIKYVCQQNSSQVCSGLLRIFISKPFSRTSFAYVYSKNTTRSTVDALNQYANRFIQQKLFGNIRNTVMDAYIASSPKCENEVSKVIETDTVTNRVQIKLMPWFGALMSFAVATAVFVVEVLFALLTFLLSTYRYFVVQ